MRTNEIPTGVRIREFTSPDESPSSERPLVLLNGIGAGVEHWGRLPRALGRHCLAIDTSRAECRKPSMANFSGAVTETVDALGYDQVDLLGLSWGGALAQETAIRHGDRLGRLVLAATLHGIQSVPPRFSAMTALMTPDRTSERFRRIAGRVYGGDIRDNPELLQDIGIERTVDPEAYSRQLRAIRNWRNTLSRLRHIDNETLVMAGQDDPIARPVNSHMMALAIRRAELHVVPKDEGGGHLFLHTRPNESATVINRFLDRTEPPKQKGSAAIRYS